MTDLLPDVAARERIASDLDTNLLVEAGAGSGKTTALVGRMVELIRSGKASVSEIAAVTFTRKAAGELRERLQEELEKRLTADRNEGGLAGNAEAQRVLSALREIDGLFVGTIHSFASKLLRERPLEAGLDPGFRELTEEVAAIRTERFWSGFLERLTAEEAPLLAELKRVGLSPSQVEPLFKTVSAQPDVEFPAPAVSAPDTEALASIRDALATLIERGESLLPDEEPPRSCSIYNRVQSLRYRRTMGWDDEATFFRALEEMFGSTYKRVTLKHWKSERCSESDIKQLREDFAAFVAEDGPAFQVMERWRHHRYSVVMELARQAASAWHEERRRAGILDFNDLLMYAVGLLRNGPDARRALGERYRRVLVDEFQDTDPVQAEILMLLSAEPGPDDAERGWLELVPRPGALFVVGDPKQSIYRFRRADMAIYDLVKRSFERFGAVVRLEANFRSVPEVAEAVNQIFSGEAGFPPEETDKQAAFAPLISQRAPGKGGVFHYSASEAKNRDEVMSADTHALAAWIAGRVSETGDRKPEDFLVLTRQLKDLGPYAEALESFGVPVEVSGAGVDPSDEIRELEIVLDALADPTDPVKTVAALVGLFFGLDYELLTRHCLDERGSLDFTRIGNRGVAPVRSALGKLRSWWDMSRSVPADAFVGALAAELGLLPFAAASPLGRARAGVVGYAHDSLRAAALDGATSLPAAVDALRTALSAKEAEAPVEPGRVGAVRVMNLHKAKGLEAPVVVLAAPVGAWDHPVTRHVERQPDGSAHGYLVVQSEDSRGWGRKPIVHAKPRDWDWKRNAEEQFEEAEAVRLLYVATTRAGEELVVSRNVAKPGASPWRALDAWLDENAAPLEVRGRPDALEEHPVSVAEVRAWARAADRARAEAADAGYEFLTVTAAAKSSQGADEAQMALDLGEATPRTGDAPESRGLSWGSAVHSVLAAAMQGIEGRELRAVARAALLEHERPVDAEGRPEELDELLGVVESVAGSELWTRAGAASRRLIEVPFTTREPGAESGGRATYVEGVVDLAFQEEDGWVIADYKTDVRTDPGFAAREPQYREQVELYARCWAELTGQPVKERILYYTTGGVETRW